VPSDVTDNNRSVAETTFASYVLAKNAEVVAKVLPLATNVAPLGMVTVDKELTITVIVPLAVVPTRLVNL